jgi:hypothetical protein
MNEKFYKVIKDTPAWDVGAILKGDANGYVSIEKLWDKEATKSDYKMSGSIVEGNPDFFQKVYPVNLLTKTVYKLKEEAKELIEKNYKDA